MQPRATWKLLVFIHTLIDQTFLTWLSYSSQCLRIYFPEEKKCSSLFFIEEYLCSKFYILKYF